MLFYFPIHTGALNQVSTETGLHMDCHIELCTQKYTHINIHRVIELERERERERERAREREKKKNMEESELGQIWYIPKKSHMFLKYFFLIQ